MKYLLPIILVLFCEPIQCAEMVESATLSYSIDDKPREAIVAEMTDEGKIVMDDGKVISSIEELRAFIREIDWNDTSIRIIMKPDVNSGEYYNMAMNALMLFQKYCRSYSLVVVKG